MKKEEIIDVALQLFFENSYEQTTITSIMKKMNLSKGGMYHYFSSKEEILEAVVNKVLLEELVEFEHTIENDHTLASKFTLLFAPSLATSTYVKNFVAFTKNQKDSLIYYKIRELAGDFWFEPLKILLLEGVETNIFLFNPTFVDQVTRLLYLYGDNIIYRTSNSENKQLVLEHEFTAFFYNLKCQIKLDKSSSSI